MLGLVSLIVVWWWKLILGVNREFSEVVRESFRRSTVIRGIQSFSQAVVFKQSGACDLHSIYSASPRRWSVSWHRAQCLLCTGPCLRRPGGSGVRCVSVFIHYRKRTLLFLSAIWKYCTRAGASKLSSKIRKPLCLWAVAHYSLFFSFFHS